MNGIDWFLIGIGVFCLIRGILRGAIAQLFGIAGAIAGFLVAAHFYEGLAAQLQTVFKQSPWLPAASFLFLFLLAWFCVGFTGFWIGRMIRRKGGGFMDRFVGAGVGVLKAFVLAILFISVLTLFLSPGHRFLSDSVLVPYIQQAARIIVEATPESVQTRFRKRQEELKDYWLKNRNNRRNDSRRGQTEAKSEHDGIC